MGRLQLMCGDPIKGLKGLGIDFAEEQQIIAKELKLAAQGAPMQRVERHGLKMKSVPMGAYFGSDPPGPGGPPGATYSNVADLLRS